MTNDVLFPVTATEAREAAALFVKQTPYADVDYLIDAAVRSFSWGEDVINALECADDDYTWEEANNARGAIEYHIKELTK